MQRIISDSALLSAFSHLEPYPFAALAVSGGPDSMALTHLARRWMELTGRAPQAFTALTVDHGLRPESKEEAAFVSSRAALLGLRHATLSWTEAKPKTGIQAAARAARYGLMTAYCRAEGIPCLAVAHTADDQAETFLMRLGRGSGLDGLSAMASVSERSGVAIIRPLLQFSKARLKAFLRAEALPFIEDPSNANSAFERVRLRGAMKACASAGIGRAALIRSASRLARSREALSQLTEAFLARHFHVAPLGNGEIAAAPFRELPWDIALRVLSHALALVGGKEDPPRMAKAERLLDEILAGKREAALGGCLLISARGALQIYREPGRIGVPALVPEPGGASIWDGRFTLAVKEEFRNKIAAYPLGEKGWDLYRTAMKDQGLPIRENRLAAMTTPAFWENGALVSAPVLGFVPDSGKCVASAQLVPALARFLKPG